MTASEFWTNILQWLIGVGGLGAVVVYLAKAFGTQLLSKDLERFKADLRHASQTEITKLGASLERKRLEHQERFRWFQGERGNAIKLVHESYISALTAIQTAEADATLAVDYAIGEFCAPSVSVASDAVDELQKALLSFGTFLPSELLATLDVSWQQFAKVVANLRWLELCFDPNQADPDDVAEEAADRIHKLVSQAKGNWAHVIGKFREAIETESA